IAPVQRRIGPRHSVIVGSSPLRPLAWIARQHELASYYAEDAYGDSQVSGLLYACLCLGARRGAKLVFYDESTNVPRSGRSRNTLSRICRRPQGARPATPRRPPPSAAPLPAPGQLAERSGCPSRL